MTVYKKTASIAFRVIAGRAYVVNPATSELHEFNETGTFIWKLLDGKGATLEKLAAGLSAEYEVDPARARDDAAEFLRFLEKNGLAERTNG